MLIGAATVDRNVPKLHTLNLDFKNSSFHIALKLVVVEG